MSSKLIASFVLAGGLAVAMGAGFLVGGLILGAALLFVALGQLALSHLAFFEERKRRLPRAVGPLPWVNLAMSYLLVAMALGLFLLKTLSDGRQDTIAKAGQAPGDETDGQNIPESLGTNTASGGERARLGNVGRGEGDDATKGGANEDNQNAMREAQVFNPDIAGAAAGTGQLTNVSAQEIPDQVEPGEADLGKADAVDELLARVGEDDENVEVGDPDAELVFEEDDNSLAFDVTVFQGDKREPDVVRKTKGQEVLNVRAGKNSLGIAVPKSMSGRCDKLGRFSRLNRAGVQNPVAVEKAVTKSLDWLTLNQNEDGSWGKTAQGAMTGFALLCYLGHCELTDSVVYGEAVSNGINYLVDLGVKKNGWLYTTNNRHGAAYAQGIATYALAESYGMTEKDFILPTLEKAVHRIVSGQKQDGGWYYLEERKGPNNMRFDDFGKNVKDASDTSVSGWQFQALKAAFNTGAVFPGVEPALEAAVKNFYRVYSPKNGGFGYRKASDSNNIRHKLTGVGSLGLQSWKTGHPSKEKKREVLTKATQHILKSNKGMSYGSEDSNLYSWYYDTQALFNYGGASWISWNRRMEPMLLAAQNDNGSWPAEGSNLTAKRGGKDADVYRTTLCTLMLEVYYRYVY